MTIEKTLKILVHFDINNKTDVKILNSTYLIFSNQEFYKNGKPKGKAFDSVAYYFWDNPLDYENFMKIHKDTPKSLSRVELVIDDGLKYDKKFLLQNLNQIYAKL